jgi:hypothetical protein
MVVTIIDRPSAIIGDGECCTLLADPRGKPMADSSHYREKAAQALRVARDSTDPELIKSLRAFAAEYNAIADAIDGEALCEDPENE